MLSEIHGVSLFMMLAMGFFGSLHCIGMCGGLVAALSLGRSRVWWSGLIVYQAGRILSYMLLGLLAGMAGMVLYGFDDMGFQKILALLAGLAMLMFALNLLGWLPDPLGRVASRSYQYLGLARLVQTAASHARPYGWLVLGMANGLLPCGLVYAALALAVAADNMLSAIGMMLWFGLGTVPAMLFAPWLLTRLSAVFRRKLLLFSALLIALMGGVVLWRAFAMHGHVMAM